MVTQLSLSLAPPPEWKNLMIIKLIEFLRDQDNGYEFRVEQFREFCEKKNYPQPADKRSYGHVITAARKLSLVKSVDVDRVTNPNANHAYCTRWAKV